MSFPILSYMIFIPFLGIIAVLVLRKEQVQAIRWASALFSFIPLVLSFFLLAHYDSSTSTMQFVEKHTWIPSLGVTYFLGADGLSVPMLFLTALLSFLSVIASFNIKFRVKEYFAFFLLLEVGMMGVFAALDFFLFYIFWEVMLVPMYFLIGIWGGPRKEYAAIKFFLYTLFGSVFMLIGILALYFTSQPHTLNMMELISQAPLLGRGFQLIVFVAFFLAFAIKVPIFPFHTWLPDAHVEAPTAVSVILAGILLKMGIYGLLRVSLPMFPKAALYYALPLALLALINIVYGALVCMAQKDLKKMVAYSSVSHMGYCILGISALTVTGVSGCVFQMFSHGLITGALFLLVGVLYDRAHTRDIDAFGGLWIKIPVYSGVMILFCMGSLGLPGLSGFISEFMVFIGSFPVFKVIVALAVLGVVITAAYFLRMIQKMFLGTFNTKWEALTEISGRELFTVIPLAILMIGVGVYPSPLADMIRATLENIVHLVTG
ncbi:MAG: NADH-quinone oxidoreductase subunit M [candidate division Zixibacteria bacterium]|nr:NADH-quinone oxidoreductase subunit M [candidate division Zixibacteria bacterium]